MNAEPLAGPEARAQTRWVPTRRASLQAAGAALVLQGLSACSVFGSKPPPIAAGPAAAQLPPVPAAVTAPATPAPLPTLIAGTITAAANLNPSVNQRPSPLGVRLYEMRTVADFAKADFMALYQADVATLGSGLVLRDEFTLLPGESRAYQRTLSPDTRFIAVFAAYRDVERATWRASAAVQPGRKQTLVLRADSLALSLAIQP
jgi:type VI secretion system protein VasD